MSEQLIPRLLTERLVLRAPVADDFPAYAQLLASPRAQRMGGPYALRAAWGLFCHDIAGWELFGHGALMIDLRMTGDCVGQVGINHGPLFPEKELGWLVYDRHEGQGYATEGAAALRDWPLAHSAWIVSSATSIPSTSDQLQWPSALALSSTHPLRSRTWVTWFIATEPISRLLEHGHQFPPRVTT